MGQREGLWVCPPRFSFLCVWQWGRIYRMCFLPRKCIARPGPLPLISLGDVISSIPVVWSDVKSRRSGVLYPEDDCVLVFEEERSLSVGAEWRDRWRYLVCPPLEKGLTREGVPYRNAHVTRSRDQSIFVGREGKGSHLVLVVAPNFD